MSNVHYIRDTLSHIDAISVFNKHGTAGSRAVQEWGSVTASVAVKTPVWPLISGWNAEKGDAIENDVRRRRKRKEILFWHSSTTEFDP